MNAIVKLSSQNQITLPMRMTNKLQVKPGSFFDIKIVGDKIQLEKIPPLESFFSKYATKKNNSIDPVDVVRSWRKDHDYQI